MVQTPENSSAASQLPDPIDRRREVAEDQGIYNPHMGEAAETGVWPDMSEESRLALEDVGLKPGPRHYPKPRATTPRRSHRGGRSFPELTENEADPNWNVEAANLTPQERSTQHNAYERATGYLDAKLEDAREAALVRDAAELGMPVEALRAARAVKAARAKKSSV